MPSVLIPRALDKRDLATDSGTRIKEWVAGLSPTSVFSAAVVLSFLLSLILIAAVWETVRKCRTSVRGYEQDRWHRLPDGSSVRVSGRENGNGPSYLGPMGSLLREGRADRNGEGHGYVPARSTGAPADMRGEAALGMSGRFEPYDPPMQRYQLSDEPTMRAYPPPQPSPRPSIATVDSTWSGETRVASVDLGKKSEDGIKSNPPGFRKNDGSLYLPHQPLPPKTVSPQTVPSLVSAPSASSFKQQQPEHGRAVSISQSINSDRTLIPLPNSPRTTTILATGGEAAFSTPKPTGTPVSSTIVPPHARTGSVPIVPSSAIRTHQRTGSQGFTPRPLGLASTPAGGVARATSLGSTVTTPDPPKVDLKRTWSMSSWVPSAFSKTLAESEKKEKEEEEVALVAKT